jgi:hypothetical protein
VRGFVHTNLLMKYSEWKRAISPSTMIQSISYKDMPQNPPYYLSICYQIVCYPVVF